MSSMLAHEKERVQAALRFGSAWRTNWVRRGTSLDEIAEIGHARGDAPAVLEPRHIPVADVARLHPDLPFLVVTLDGQTRGYPLEVLVWHEVVNDTLGGAPIAVTYDPPSASLAVYGRTVGDETLQFAAAGLRHNSSALLYDLEDENLWQQISGRCLVGDRVGARLPWAPFLVVRWEDFVEGYPEATVLGTPSGTLRDYGRTPWHSFEVPGRVPPHAQGPVDRRMSALERILAAPLEMETVAYGLDFLAERGVCNDDRGQHHLAAFWGGEVLNTLDAERVSHANKVGTGALYHRPLYHGAPLTFTRRPNGSFRDEETRSTWSFRGEATEGLLAGQRLTPILHRPAFWYAWSAHAAKTVVVRR